MDIIKVRKLYKKFKDLVAVDGIDLDVKKGECLGILGPNGAGKTTLIRMITAVSPPNAGTIHVLGKDLNENSRQIKAEFGVIPQIDNLDFELTVIQNLTTFARYYDIPKEEAIRRSVDILKLFQLEEKTNSQIKELSGGMRRRLILARGLINEPKIIILDEPTTGLDPQSKFMVWQKLKELKRRGITELISTQNMDEAAILCDRVAILHNGRILALGSPKKLVKQYVGDKILEIEVTPDEKESVIKELRKRRIDYIDTGGTIQIIKQDADKLADDFKALSWHVWPRIATLEDVFLELTGRTLIE